MMDWDTIYLLLLLLLSLSIGRQDGCIRSRSVIT